MTIDFAVLLQFKVPFYNSRQHTQGACPPGHCSWSAWGKEHFRFWVDVGSNQQAAMRRYEHEIGSHKYKGLSTYVTPAYWTEQDHNSRYLHGQILEMSAAPLPSVFDGLVGWHSFSYVGASGQGVVMSEPREVEHTSLQDQLTSAVDDVADAEAPSLAAFVTENPVTQAVRLDPGAYDVESVAGAVSYLQDSAALLGAAFVFMGHGDTDAP